MTIEPTTRGSDILSFLGVERARIDMDSERRGVIALVASPSALDDDGDYIDPDDYPDTTAYLNALPGVAERFKAYEELTDSDFEDWPRDRDNRNVQN
jgi:hypothetical protein